MMAPALNTHLMYATSINQRAGAVKAYNTLRGYSGSVGGRYIQSHAAFFLHFDTNVMPHI
jgi:hypothetical protein